MHGDRMVERDDSTDATMLFLGLANVADLVNFGDGLVVQPEAEPVVDPAYDGVKGGVRGVYGDTGSCAAQEGGLEGIRERHGLKRLEDGRVVGYDECCWSIQGLRDDGWCKADDTSVNRRGYDG